MIEKQQPTRRKRRVKQQKTRRNKVDEIEAIVGHDIDKKSKKVARLRIKWVGYAQTTIEFAKNTKETAWEMVEEYAKKKNITI